MIEKVNKEIIFLEVAMQPLKPNYIFATKSNVHGEQCFIVTSVIFRHRRVYW